MNRYRYPVALGAFLFIFQLVLAIQFRLDGLESDSTNFVSDFITNGVPAKLILTIAGYFLIGLLAHTLPLIIASKIIIDLSTRGAHWIRDWLSRRGSQTLTLIATILLMVIANHTFFPNSVGIPHSDLLLIQWASPALIYGLPLIFGAASAYWISQIASQLVRLVVLATVVALMVACVSQQAHTSHPTTSRDKPDIIIIGIDSLRPDFLRAFGYQGKSLTPTLDQFIDSSILFEHAYTPMARTFVAYMSILSGRYPTRHGARENLFPISKIDRQELITHRLHAAGYTNVLAMDESRFANFDIGYGFDQLVTPPPGVLDFLLGDFFDTIGTNLAQLIPYSGVWMPHVAGNRAAAATYQPDIHDAKVARALDKADSNKPIFMVAHFCIAHVPYVQDHALQGISYSPYEAALQVADAQVNNVLKKLNSVGRLRNALVVMLSDHGEGLGLKHDQWLAENSTGTEDEAYLGAYFGHGMPAMAESQMHVLLAMQRYVDGQPTWPAARSPSIANLVDIVPTILFNTNTPFFEHDFDGQSLIDASGEPKKILERQMFVESGISGRSLQKKHVDETEVSNEFSQRFEISSDHHLQLKQSEFRQKFKQRGVLFQSYGVSSWPLDMFNGASDCWMKLDRSRRVARCLPKHTSDPIVVAYKAMLCKHFEQDVEFTDGWCSSYIQQ